MPKRRHTLGPLGLLPVLCACASAGGPPSATADTPGSHPVAPQQAPAPLPTGARDASGAPLSPPSPPRPSPWLPGPPPVAVQELMQRVQTGDDPYAVVDREFMRRMARAERLVWEAEGGGGGGAASPAPNLAKLLRLVAAECQPRLAAGGGYEAIALPPPHGALDPAAAEEVNAVIGVLRAGVEVTAYCPGSSGRDRAELAIALGENPDGSWRVLGWRDFLFEQRRSLYVESL